jgi:hypothetical protein
MVLATSSQVKGDNNYGELKKLKSGYILPTPVHHVFFLS